jgi:hypothetical protein
MMKKRLSKKIWYGSDVDSEGKPVLPPLAKDSEDLEGLHYGELYLHIADDKLSLWTRTLTDQIKQIGGEGSGGELWKLMETESGEKYIFSAFDVATQKDFASFVDGKMLDLPSIYDGLPIDYQTLYWEETTEETTDEEGNAVTKVVKVLKSKGGGSGEGTIKDVAVTGLGNAITNVELSADKTVLVFTKGLEFAEKKYLNENFYNKKWIDEHYVTLDTSQTISGKKDFTGGLLVKGNEIVWDERGFWLLDGDLLVTGGITSFADNPKYTPSTVMNALVLDNQTLDINEYGQLFVKNGGGTNVEIVESLPSEYKENTLYVVVQ